MKAKEDARRERIAVRSKRRVTEIVARNDNIVNKCASLFKVEKPNVKISGTSKVEMQQPSTGLNATTAAFSQTTRTNQFTATYDSIPNGEKN